MWDKKEVCCYRLLSRAFGGKHDSSEQQTPPPPTPHHVLHLREFDNKEIATAGWMHVRTGNNSIYDCSKVLYPLRKTGEM